LGLKVQIVAGNIQELFPIFDCKFV
jgi:hypothetical protein